MRGAHRQPWRPSPLIWVTAAIATLGLALVMYPSAASWLTQLNQSRLITTYSSAIDDSDPEISQQLADARRYNDALTAGVRIEANANIAIGDGTTADDTLVYRKMLSVGPAGIMARVKIPAIDLDLPVYHGTSDQVLELGAGHLEGSHLPVGGIGTHSVVTAHRGLANATMFTHLDRVKIGDEFTFEVLGEALTYRVVQTKVVEPDDTDTLRASADHDYATLITCTPLGINTHRILVTGERVLPTPEETQANIGKRPEIPRFPWWIIITLGGLTLISGYVWIAGRQRPRRDEPAGASPPPSQR